MLFIKGVSCGVVCFRIGGQLAFKKVSSGIWRFAGVQGGLRSRLAGLLEYMKVCQEVGWSAWQVGGSAGVLECLKPGLVHNADYTIFTDKMTTAEPITTNPLQHRISNSHITITSYTSIWSYYEPER